MCCGDEANVYYFLFYRKVKISTKVLEQVRWPFPVCHKNYTDDDHSGRMHIDIK